MKQTRMKSFVEQSERHYVSVPRHHLWSRIYIILRVLVSHICRVYVSVCISVCSIAYVCDLHVYVRVSVYYDTHVSSLLFSYSRSLFLTHSLSLAFFYSHLSLLILSLVHHTRPTTYTHARTFLPCHVLPAVTFSSLPRLMCRVLAYTESVSRMEAARDRTNRAIASHSISRLASW